MHLTAMDTSLLKFDERFEGCIIGGAIGDAWGSGYENASPQNNPSTYYWGGYKKDQIPEWTITDDTQLTLATCEALADIAVVTPEVLSSYFLKYFKQRKLTGIGASTVKALQSHYQIDVSFAATSCENVSRLITYIYTTL